MKYQYEPEFYVYQECTGEQINEKTTKFVDVAEDPQGRDLITYECPACGKMHQSYVVRR